MSHWNLVNVNNFLIEQHKHCKMSSSPSLIHYRKIIKCNDKKKSSINLTTHKINHRTYHSTYVQKIFHATKYFHDHVKW